MTDRLITHLADVIRRYNTAPYGSGGRRTIGTLILQRGTKRIPLEHKRIPEEWPEGSTVPEDVAEILLSMQFDQKKLLHLYLMPQKQYPDGWAWTYLGKRIASWANS